MSAEGEWEARVEALWAALDEHEPQVFLAALDALAAEREADDPAALFERASGRDSLGFEAEAEELYRRALVAGLTGSSRRRATIQLASTLRNLGRVEEAVGLLEAERAAAPDELDDAVAAFLARALADAGRSVEAVGLALGALAPHLPRSRGGRVPPRRAVRALRAARALGVGRRERAARARRGGAGAAPDEAVLVALASNERARRFYERRGWTFAEVRTEPRFGDRPTEVALYRRRLRPALT